METPLSISYPSCWQCSVSSSSSCSLALYRRQHFLSTSLKPLPMCPWISVMPVQKCPPGLPRALVVDPSDSAQESMDNFIARMEKAWLISKQPQPVSCSSCNAVGFTECPWCKGTGFFILGDNMLCEVPSRNTTCRICLGQGSVACKDCKGTGYRARWLGNPPPKKSA